MVCDFGLYDIDRLLKGWPHGVLDTWPSWIRRRPPKPQIAGSNPAVSAIRDQATWLDEISLTLCRNSSNWTLPCIEVCSFTSHSANAPRSSHRIDSSNKSLPVVSSL